MIVCVKMGLAADIQTHDLYGTKSIAHQVLIGLGRK